MAPDPWQLLFAAGKRDRDSDASDIVPYWVFQVAGAAKIERHVPHLPLSRDNARLLALQRSLAVYRLAFGQPRQDDLVDYLIENLPQSDIPRVMERLSIDLSPPDLGRGNEAVLS